MSYQHILVAVDLDRGTMVVTGKAVTLAKSLGAKLSLVHVDDEKTHDPKLGSLIGLNTEDIEQTHPTLSERVKLLGDLSCNLDYPVEDQLLVQADLAHGLEQALEQTKADLVICGHHHSFLSRWLPSSRKLINTSHVDMLIVQLESQ